MEKPTVENIIDKAIAHEEIAYSFYTDFIDKVRDSASKSTLEFLANEEFKHKAKVEYLYCNAAFCQTDGG